MTAEQRADAIAAFGFTRRQARFLVTVALHGGYCLRRQYETFAGIRYDGCIDSQPRFAQCCAKFGYAGGRNGGRG